MPYLATVNVPGYLPMDDDPPVFDTISDAWSYLADERRNSEDAAETIGLNDSTDPDPAPYSDTVNALDAAASAGISTGAIYGDTPGYDGSHDLGLAYTVTETEDTPERN